MKPRTHCPDCDDVLLRDEADDALVCLSCHWRESEDIHSEGDVVYHGEQNLFFDDDDPYTDAFYESLFEDNDDNS